MYKHHFYNKAKAKNELFGIYHNYVCSEYNQTRHTLLVSGLHKQNLNKPKIILNIQIE